MKVLTTTMLVAVVAATAAVPGADAAARPDLVVTKLSDPPAALPLGTHLTIVDTVRNRGRGRARATTIAYWLSTDARRGSGDVALGRRTLKALPGRRSARGRAVVAVPAMLGAGSYHLIACADGAGRVKERSERNNCRASRVRTTVATAQPGGVQPAPPPTLPPSPAPTAPPASSTATPTPTPTASPSPEPTATPTPTPTTSPSPEPTATPDPEPGDKDTFPPMTPDPLTVSHTLESDNAVTRTLGRVGGEVTTTAENGTTYTLTLPTGALVSDIDVTLTPVQAVDGSPVGEDLIGAVEILPHGLQLLQAATLTIDPAGDPGPVAGQTGFLSHEGGEDFHLYPLALGQELKLHLTHFSTPGVAQASDADRQAVISQPPQRYRARYEQLMEELLRKTRAEQVADENAGLPTDEIATLLRGYWNDVVWPIAEPAFSDDTKAPDALAELFGWARQVQLLSLEAHPKLKAPHDSVMPNAVAIIENAIVKGYQKCVNDHDLAYIVRLIGWARAAELLGMKIGEDAYDKALRCANFEIDFNSRIDFDLTIDGQQQSHRGSGHWSVQGLDIPIDITGITQSAKFTWKSYDYLYTIRYRCEKEGGGADGVTEERIVSVTGDDAVTVMLSMDLNLREPGQPPLTDPSIRVRLFGYDGVKETYQRTVVSRPCGESGLPPDEPQVDARWRTEYDQFHGDEAGGGMGDWDAGEGDLIGTKFYDRNDEWGNYSESTQVELWHKPLT